MFITFSYELANCVGTHLAYREVRTVVAMLIQRFDMKFEEGYTPDDWLKAVRDDAVIVKGKLPVKLTPRLRDFPYRYTEESCFFFPLCKVPVERNSRKWRLTSS